MNLSILIAHYNDSDRLKRLISSIPIDEDIEIIIVDDNSKPEHKENLKNISKLNPKIIFLYNKDNKGPGAVRNIGLKYISRKYFLIADSDDYFLTDAFNIIKKYTEEKCEFDIVIFPSTTVSENPKFNSRRGQKNNRRIQKYIKKPNRKNLMEMLSKLNSTPNKIYNTEFIKRENILFGEGVVSEDVYFITKVIANSNKIIVEEKEIYCIVHTGVSLMTINPSEKKASTHIDVAIWKKQYLRKELSASDLKYCKDNLNYWIYYLISNEFEKSFKKKELIKMLESKMLSPFIRLFIRILVFFYE